MTSRSYATHWMRPVAAGDRPVTLPWPERFLAELAASGNVTTACRAAGVTHRAALELRWNARPFAVAWDRALGQARDRRWDLVLAAVLG